MSDSKFVVTFKQEVWLAHPRSAGQHWSGIAHVSSAAGWTIVRADKNGDTLFRHAEFGELVVNVSNICGFQEYVE
jgi:hypothetical protein